MKIVVQILMAISAIALILSALFWLNILEQAILNVSGQGFLWASIACSIYALALHIIKPLGGDGKGE